MSDFVTASAPSGGIKWEDHKGALLLIEPLTFEPQVVTAFGAADAVKANVRVIDGAGAPDSYDETLIFPKLLVSQTKTQIGNKIVGRLTQGQAKPGQSAPWLITSEVDPGDIAKAEAWVAQNAKSSVTSAAAPF